MLRRDAVLAFGGLFVFLIGFCAGIGVGSGMTTTLTVGSVQPALVQSGSLLIGGTTSFSTPFPTLPAPSRPGTTLVAWFFGDLVTSAPAGWQQAGFATQGGLSTQVWIYPNNPGGIQVQKFRIQVVSSTTDCHMSEWSNVLGVSPLETSGTATATAGTTLTPVAGAPTANPGDVVIAAWGQALAGAGTVTFTSPPGYSRLVDNGSTSVQGHDDIEYLLSPPQGVTQNPTLTSSGTTITAAGAVIVLKAGTTSVDLTNYLANSSVSIKQNTSDFKLYLGGRLLLESDTGSDNSGLQLEDGSGVLLLDPYVPQLGDTVTWTGPSWSGRVVSVQRSSIVERNVNYIAATVAAINQTAAPGGSPPNDLADVYSPYGYLDKEDSFKITLEDGSGSLLLEDAAPYSHLTVRDSQNQDGTVTTYGSLETYTAGFQAGQTVRVSNLDEGYSGKTFVLTNVTTDFIGLASPHYTLEFGDAYPTLQAAGGGVLTQVASQATIQPGSAVPAGTLAYAQITADTTGITAAADVAGLSVTVNVATGRRIRIRAAFYAVVSTVANDVGLLIIEDGSSTVLNQARTAALPTANGPGVAAEVVLQPAAGVATYKVTVQRLTGTGTLTFGGAATAPAFIVVEDIGI